MPTHADPAAESQRVCGAHCPKCGYDVSGEVETWKDSCPLIGRCSECGVRFRWLHALRSDWCDANGGVNRWSFEQSDRVSLWRFVRTSMRLLVPERFFGGMCKHHVRRGWRVLALLMFWVGVWGLAVTGPIIAGRLLPHLEIYGFIWNIPDLVQSFLEGWPFWLGSLIVASVWMVVQVLLGMALARSRKASDIAFRDALRVAGYGVAGQVMLQSVWALGIWFLLVVASVSGGGFLVFPLLLCSAVWALVTLTQWWPMALGDFFHCRRRGSLVWLPTLMGAVAGAVVGGLMYLVTA